MAVALGRLSVEIKQTCMNKLSFSSLHIDHGLDPGACSLPCGKGLWPARHSALCPSAPIGALQGPFRQPAGESVPAVSGHELVHWVQSEVSWILVFYEETFHLMRTLQLDKVESFRCLCLLSVSLSCQEGQEQPLVWLSPAVVLQLSALCIMASPRLHLMMLESQRGTEDLLPGTLQAQGLLKLAGQSGLRAGAEPSVSLEKLQELCTDVCTLGS